jgi:hypothetical protein
MSEASWENEASSSPTRSRNGGLDVEGAFSALQKLSSDASQGLTSLATTAATATAAAADTAGILPVTAVEAGSADENRNMQESISALSSTTNSPVLSAAANPSIIGGGSSESERVARNLERPVRGERISQDNFRKTHFDRGSQTPPRSLSPALSSCSNASTSTPRKTSSKIVLGICAMDKKARSKPMSEILSRLDLEVFQVIIFGDECIKNEPIEAWPIVDVLIAFYSNGFPLTKAEEYVALRAPFVMNDLAMQVTSLC